MIEPMQFSETPLWWRLLVLAATLAVGSLLYAASTLAVSRMSNALVAVIAIGMFVAGLIITVYATRRDNRRSSNR